MALKCGLALVVIGASILANVSMANRDWNPTFPPNWNNTNNYFLGNRGQNSTFPSKWNNTNNHFPGNRDQNSTFPPQWNNTNNYFWGYWHRNALRGPNKVVVGGPDNSWRFGFNYTDWAIKNGPFFMNDILVFKYDPPNDTTFPHSVYLLPNFQSFQNCNLSRAWKIGDVNAGGGQGFEFALKRWRPYYFACGEHDGIHCNDGLMKFSIWPLIRRY